VPFRLTWGKLAAGLLALTVVVASVRIGAELLPKRLYWTQPDMARMTRDVAHLAPVLSVLEDEGVKAFRDQDWCRNISYSAGSFSSNFESTTCNYLFDDQPAAFTGAANSDFARVEDAFNESGVWVYCVGQIEYDGNGRLTRAEFALVGAPWDFNRWSYWYDPGHPMPEDMAHERIYTRIDSNWFFQWEDWM
jgi:hypothetical protein